MRYIPYEIYKNLSEFLTYRNVSHKNIQLSEEDFTRRLAQYECIVMKGTRDDKYGKRPFYVILIAPGSAYSAKTPSFKTMVSNNILADDMNNKAEIVIISERPLTNFIKKQIHVYKVSKPGIWIEHHEYDKFSIVVPKHIEVPHHSIMTEEEIQKVCDHNYAQKEKFPRILSMDPPVVWLGARPGDVIKIIRTSEAVGHSIGYRYVVRAPM